MNVFKKMSQFFSRLFSDETTGRGSKKTALDEREFVLKQKQSLSRIASTLTELIFQRKKMESQLVQLKNESLHIEEDLVTAAEQDKDSVAIYLLERQQEVQKEMQLLQTHHQKVVGEIEKTKELKVSLVSQMERSRLQFSLLKSRKEALETRQKLENDFKSVSGLHDSAQGGLQGMDEEILRLEASLESMDIADSDRQQEVRQLRRSKNEAVLQSQWVVKKAELKKTLNKRLLPESADTLSNVKSKLTVRQVVAGH